MKILGRLCQIGTREIRNAQRILFGKPEKEESYWEIRWENDITMNIQKWRTICKQFTSEMNEGFFEKNDILAGFNEYNSLMRASVNFQLANTKLVNAVSSINEAVRHLFVVSPLEHQEECRKENNSRIEGKRKLGEECELLCLKYRNLLGIFRRFPNIAFVYIL